MTFEGTISLSGLGFSGSELGKAAAGIIGRGGSGISALTKQFPGLFVKVYDTRRGVGVRARAADCDTVYISGRNQEDVTTAATVIVTNARAVVNGTPPSGPQIKVTCPIEAVASVIGKGGNGLRKIQTTAGDYCHIHYNRDDGLFEITAQTQAACDRAKIYIGQAIRDFLKPKHQVDVVASRQFTHSFLSLEVDDYDSDNELLSPYTRNPQSSCVGYVMEEQRLDATEVTNTNGTSSDHVWMALDEVDNPSKVEHLVEEEEEVVMREVICEADGYLSPTPSTTGRLSDNSGTNEQPPPKPKRRPKLKLVSMPKQPSF